MQFDDKYILVDQNIIWFDDKYILVDQNIFWFGRIRQSAAFLPLLRRGWGSAMGRGIHKPLFLIALPLFEFEI